MPVLRYYTMMLHKPESHTGHDIIQMSIILSAYQISELQSQPIYSSVWGKIAKIARTKAIARLGTWVRFDMRVPFAQCNCCNAMFCTTGALYKCNTLFSGIVEGKLRNSTWFYQGSFMGLAVWYLWIGAAMLSTAFCFPQSWAWDEHVSHLCHSDCD